MEVCIPFLDEWRTDMLNGQKVATTRTRRMAAPGDTFQAFGARFIIQAVKKMSLSNVALRWFRAEGFISPTAFREVWTRLHPRNGWQPDKQVWLHVFRKEAGEQSVPGEATGCADGLERQ